MRLSCALIMASLLPVCSLATEGIPVIVCLVPAVTWTQQQAKADSYAVAVWNAKETTETKAQLCKGWFEVTQTNGTKTVWLSYCITVAQTKTATDALSPSKLGAKISTDTICVKADTLREALEANGMDQETVKGR